MWIKEIHIDGFGIFKGLNFRDLSEGLNIFSGMNESGKSTLLEFVRRILFGFPDRRTKRNPYPALKGGRHGGRLLLQSSDGESYTIERFSEGTEKETIIDSKGSRVEISDLNRLFSHANERIYNNVYAFGLSELQDFQTLNSDEVRERLYSAGTGTGGRAISELIRSLEKERGELYLPQGIKPEINLLFKKIRERDLGLRGILGNVEKFDHLQEELKKISEKISEIELKREKINKGLIHIKKLLSVWEDWRRLRDAEDQLSRLPEIKSFPERGVEKLDLNVSLIQDLEEETAKRSEELEINSVHASKLQVNDKVIALKENILSLQKRQEKYAEDLKDLPVLVENQKHLRSALKESLKEIGPEWTAEKVMKFDISIPIKEKVRENRQNMLDLQDKIQDLDRDKKSLEKSMEKVRKECNEKIENIKGSERPDRDEEDILLQKGSIKNLRIKLPQLMELEANLQSLKQVGMFKNTMFPKQLIYALLVLTLSISGYIIFSVFQRSIEAGIGILSALILFIVIYSLFNRVRSRRDFKDKSERLQKTDGGPYPAAGGLLDIHQLKSQIKSLREEILEEAGKCGFDRIPSFEKIEDRDELLLNKLETANTFKQKRKEIDLLESELDLLQSDHEKLDKSLGELRQKYLQLQESWETWLTKSGFEKGLSPEGVLDIFNLIKGIKEKIKNLESLEENVRKIEKSIRDYEKDVGDLIQNAGMGPFTQKNNALVKIEGMSSELDAALKNKGDLDQLKFEREKLKIEVKNLEKKKAERKKAVEMLFKQAEVDSEQAFREMAENWEKKTLLSQEIKRSQENIKKFSGEGESYSQFLRELMETSPDALEAEKAELETALNDISDEWDDLKENRGSIKNQIEQIKQEEESSRLRMAYEADLEELKNKSDIWAVLTLARSVLKKAVENYERERQPEVVQEAQRFFSLMTSGTYSRIYAPLDETPIFVETSTDNVRREIQELSRGTAEQLYLSLRFGFIREFSQRSESLPVIFDDILVNFDPKRSKAACQAIKELSQNHQVIFFTCHPETVKMFQEYEPEVKFLSIG